MRGSACDRRWTHSERAGRLETVEVRAASSWGLAARGALVEAGGPVLVGADLDRRPIVWSELAAKLYAQAAANRWDPATAVEWTDPRIPYDVELAVIQVMTYLIENEQTALLVPARFLGRIHPHYREVLQFLATQIADEARHIELFNRRAKLSGLPLGISSVSGRSSLQSLLDEPDWASASLLLSVLGEGSFLSLLSFLEQFAPDPVTARVAHLALQDESRHVAFALGHLDTLLTEEPKYRDRLRIAIERRHDTLVATSGLSPSVHDALIVLAAGALTPEAIGVGWKRVLELEKAMDEGRQRRLMRLGFSDREAARLSSLHTKNFM